MQLSYLQLNYRIPSKLAKYAAVAINCFPNGGCESKKNVLLIYKLIYFP